MRIIYLLLTLGFWQVAIGEVKTEIVNDPNFEDEAVITAQTEQCIGQNTSIVAKRECYEQCTSKVVSNMATKICLAIADEVETSYLEQVYLASVKKLETIISDLAATSNEDNQWQISYHQAFLQRLQKSQAAFKQSLNPLCDFEATEFLFGTGEGVIYLNCSIRKQLERSQEILAIMEVAQ